MALAVTPNVYFSLLTHTKQILFVTFRDTTAGIGASFRSHTMKDGQTKGQTDMKVEIVIQVLEKFEWYFSFMSLQKNGAY